MAYQMEAAAVTVNDLEGSLCVSWTFLWIERLQTRE